MKRGKVIALCAVFAGLMLTKLLFPDVGAEARDWLRSSLEREGEYVAAFRDLGRSISLRKSGSEDQIEAPTPTESPAQMQVVSYYVEDAAVSGEEDAPEEPAAVAAFLESQAPYADLELPESVDYGYVPLPFVSAVPVAGRQSSGFGYRMHPILGTVRFHYGTDVAALSGEAICAFADGIVTFAGYDESFGWHMKIDHGGGWVTHYCHCSALRVSEGETVYMGDTVALVGATGLATGPHLHFELTRNGVYLNPEYYINI